MSYLRSLAYFSPSAGIKSSAAAPVLQAMIDQPFRRRPLPPVPLACSSRVRERTRARYCPRARDLPQLRLESLTFDAAWNTEPRLKHGAPVENLQPSRYRSGEQKANIIFAPYSPLGHSAPLNSCKTPARSSVPASPPLHTSSVADTRGTSGRRVPPPAHA
jgi:hypothetical protein